MRLALLILAVLSGGVLIAGALFLGYAAIDGDYYPALFDSEFGHMAGALLVAMGRDISIAVFFWAGVLLIAASILLRKPKR